jgi:hypothetical protein
VTTSTKDNALLRYRVMAYLVGTLLVVLVIGVIIDNHAIEVGLGTAHGYLYMVLLITIADLWRRRRIPFLSFYAERQITARVTDGRW